MSLTIIGVDPGSLVTGYGVIEMHGARLRRVDSGTIRMQPSAAMPERLERIYAGLIEVIASHHPDEFSIETAFYGKNVQSTLKLGHVRGVALLAAMHRHLGIAEYSPREVKKSVTGSGAASKQQVQYMVRALLEYRGDFQRSDEADALALAITHALHINQPRRTAVNWAAFVEQHPDRVRT